MKMTFAAQVLPLLLCAVTLQSSASEFACPRGVPVNASLGDGVTMQTCLWEKSPGDFVRSGPMELVKNGITILQAGTDTDGRLHGRYISLDDDGKLLEKGNYVRGKKDGEWTVTDDTGGTRLLHFTNGSIVE